MTYSTNGLLKILNKFTMGININFKEEFIKKLGKPDSEKYLDEYLIFVNNPPILTENSYQENHHILPISIFPEFKSIKQFPQNIIRLNYEDHIQCHILLAKAYNIKQFIAPLNYLNFIDKTSEEWKNIFDNSRKKVGEKVKLFWKNLSEEEYNKRREIYRKANNTPERIEYTRNSSINQWKNQNYRSLMVEKLTIINKNIEKRKDASIKIKKLWADPNWRNAMEEKRRIKEEIRKQQKGKRTNSTKLKEKWADPSWRAKMMQARQSRKHK